MNSKSSYLRHFQFLAMLAVIWGCSPGQPPEAPRPSYQLVESWGGSGSEPGKLDQPQGLTVSPDGEVYVTDAGNCRLQVFSDQGQLLRSWGDCSNGPFQKPVDVAFHPQGRVLVADFLLDQVLAFSPDGSFESAWGGSGDGPGEFSSPVGLAVDAQGRVYVSEFYNNRIQVFTGEGEHLASWKAEGAENPLHYPTKPAIGGGKGLWVSDHRTRLLYFDLQGTLLREWAPSQGWKGRIEDVIGVFVDRRNRLHVADSRIHHVQLFSAEGESLAAWKLPPEPAGAHFRAPTGLSGDGQGHIYVSDIANHQIHKLKIIEP